MAGFVAGRGVGVEVFGEAALVIGQQFADARGGRGFDDQSGVMILVQAPDDFGIVVGRGVGVLLAGERNQQAGIVLLQVPAGR